LSALFFRSSAVIAFARASPPNRANSRTSMGTRYYRTCTESNNYLSGVLIFLLTPCKHGEILASVSGGHHGKESSHAFNVDGQSGFRNRLAPGIPFHGVARSQNEGLGERNAIFHTKGGNRRLRINP
jgi:hypothetical protein